MVRSLRKITRSRTYAFYTQYVTRIAGGVLVLLILPLKLTEIETGLWFLILSLGFAANIADAGFTNIVVTFVAKEKSAKNGDLEGLYSFILQNKTRIARVYAPALGVITTSIFFLVEHSHGFLIVWITYYLLTIVLLFNSVNVSIIEGLGSVASAGWIRAISGLMNFLSMALFLTFNFGLWSLPLSMLTQTLTVFTLSKRYMTKSISLHRSCSDKIYSRKLEMIKLMKRYSLSWISGYAQNHALVPLLSLTNGLIISGQIAIIMNIMRLLFGFAQVMLRRNIENYSKNSVTLNISEQKSAFKKDFIYSLFIYLILLLSINFLVFKKDYLLVGKLSQYADTLPSGEITFILSLFWLSIAISAGISTYFRSSGIEHFALLGLVINLLSLTFLYIQPLIGISFEAALIVYVFGQFMMCVAFLVQYMRHG